MSGTAEVLNPFCSDCKAELPQGHTGPCPQCGSLLKTFRVHAHDTLNVKASLEGELRSTYYQKNPRALALNIVITILTSASGFILTGWVGFLGGLLIGLAVLRYAPAWKEKVIEKSKLRSEG
jgi:hypothetical protein